jgi:malonate-semialdehyde dehydrogenase (acetylating)/methylmalonate-semialdehyde dehydrogenase
MNQKSVGPSLVWPTQPLQATSFIDGEFVSGGSVSSNISSPYNNQPLGSVISTSSSDVERAVTSASRASKEWAGVPGKERASLLLKLRTLMLGSLERLSSSAALESGKTFAEAKAEVLKAIEVLEFAASLQNSDDGGAIEVSRGVTCQYRREPLGVTVGITPFNFPAMVPMWMIPISLAVGNAFILKPSDKVPFTPSILAQCIAEAGFPKGIFSVVNGGREVVQQLVSHREVAAVGFVGSSPVAASVYSQATGLGKRALCLGGAKNHLIVVPDADPAITVDGVVGSFTGCAGQRCMAASVLVAVGDVQNIIEEVVRLAGGLVLGRDMGALIDRTAKTRISTAIEHATQEGARLLLDGRAALPPNGCEEGNWLGPTVLDGVEPNFECACTELFGPVLSIIRVKTLDEALRLESMSRYGNALSVFTSSGNVAERVTRCATSGMVGINVGVPVPREPFSFGGTKESKFGSGDITGWGGVEHWSHRKKITTKWASQSDKNWMS